MIMVYLEVETLKMFLLIPCLLLPVALLIVLLFHALLCLLRCSSPGSSCCLWLCCCHAHLLVADLVPLLIALLVCLLCCSFTHGVAHCSNLIFGHVWGFGSFLLPLLSTFLHALKLAANSNIYYYNFILSSTYPNH